MTSIKSAGSPDLAKALNEGEDQQHETDEVAHKEPAKIKLGIDDLQQYETGLLVIKLVDAELAHSDCFVDFVMDDMAFPSFRSSKARSKHVTFNETGDAMVRELDFSRITIRIREKEKDSDKEKIYAKLVGQTLEVLKKHLYQTMPLTLVGDDGRPNKIHVQLKYIPVKMHLHPSESINNMGTLRCDILDAADLPAADRNGLSDPYCKLFLNGQEIYKTAVQKKTLHPSWNEFFEIPVPSRTAAKFRIEVYDRDIGDKDDYLGAAEANLQLLEPFQSQEVRLKLDGQSGVIRIKLLFRSDYVTRKRQGSGTFSGTFATPGKIVGAPVKGIGKTTTFLKSFRRKTNIDAGASPAADGDFGTNNTPLATIDSAEEKTGHSLVPPNQPPLITSTSPPSSPPATQPQQRLHAPHGSDPFVANGSLHAASSRPGTSADTDNVSVLTQRRTEQGTAAFTVVSATGFHGHNVRALIKQQQGKGMKEVHKTKAVKASPEGVVHWGDNDIFRTRCGSDAYFSIQLKDVHTFGADEDYGEAALALSGGIAGQQTVQIGKGTVLVQTEWKPVQQVLDGASDVASLRPSSFGGDKSPKGKLRKSIGFGSK